MNTSPIEFVEYAGDSFVRPEPAAAPAQAAAMARLRPGLAPAGQLTVLVLEGEYRLTGAVLFCLSQQPGLVVHLLTRRARSPYRYSTYVRQTHLFAADKPDAGFVAFTQQVAQTTQAQVLLPVDVAGMRWAIAHRPALETTPETALRVLPLPSAANYEIAADKGLLAIFMQQHHIPAPDTLVDIEHNLAAKLVGFRFPVLLKPIDGAGGRGIVRYYEAAELLRAVAELPAGSRYIIQNCLVGYDIDCNVLYQNGQLVAHSIQKGLVPTGGEYAPTEAIEFVHNEAVLAVADRLMKALNWNGIAHLDLRYDAEDQQIKVIEINTRFWLTVVGSALTAKVNFPALACEVAVGRPVQAAPFALGRYIPFVSFMRQRFGRHRPPQAAGGIHFTWRDTSLRAFLGDPLTKLYRAFTDAA